MKLYFKQYLILIIVPLNNFESKVFKFFENWNRSYKETWLQRTEFVLNKEFWKRLSKNWNPRTYLKKKGALNP